MIMSKPQQSGAVCSLPVGCLLTPSGATQYLRVYASKIPHYFCSLIDIVALHLTSVTPPSPLFFPCFRAVPVNPIAVCVCVRVFTTHRHLKRLLQETTAKTREYAVFLFCFPVCSLRQR